MTTSMKPALSLTNFTCCHVVPPSTVLYNPRSALGAHVAPTAATYTMFGFVGWTTMRPMCCVFSSPSDCQVMPPSTDLYTPQPGATLLRALPSPVPAYIVFGSLGAMAMSPIDAVGMCSQRG